MTLPDKLLSIWEFHLEMKLLLCRKEYCSQPFHKGGWRVSLKIAFQDTEIPNPEAGKKLQL